MLPTNGFMVYFQSSGQPVINITGVQSDITEKRTGPIHYQMKHIYDKLGSDTINQY